MPDFLNMALGPLKLKAWLAIAAALALVATVVITIADIRDKRLIETAEDGGAADAVAQGHEQTLDQLGEASHGAAALNRGGERNAARYAQCLQDSDRPGACERYRPL